MSESDLSIEIQSLKEREEILIREKEQSEVEFGKQRAKFMDLFKLKEDELNSIKETNKSLEKKNEELESEIKNLTEKIDEIKSEMMIVVVNKEDEIIRMQQKSQEEAASFQHILKESVAQAHQNALMKFEEEKMEWMRSNDKLQQELKDLKSKLNQETEGPLSSIAKTLQKRIIIAKKEEEPENLENSMKKAQEDIELLKSVVTPLEDEIFNLKRQLMEKTEQLDHYLNQSTSTTDASTPDGGGGGGNENGDEDGKKEIQEINKSMHSERGSRTDLEMYVTVLNIQKDVLKKDYDKIKEQLEEAERDLQQDRDTHEQLKKYLHLSSEHFIEVQKLLNMDIQRLESVLTDEQQALVIELKAKDVDRKKVEKRVEHLRELRIREELIHNERKLLARNKQHQQPPTTTTNDLELPPRSSNLTPVLKDFQQQQQQHLQQQQQPLYNNNDPTTTTITTATSNLNDDVFSDELSNVIPPHSPSPPTSSTGHDGDDAFPQQKARQQLQQQQQQQQRQHQQRSEEKLKTRATTSQHLDIGQSSRLVSDIEWQKLQIEVKTARDKLTKPCPNCSILNEKLKSSQESEKKLSGQVKTLIKHLDVERLALSKQEVYIKELEDSLRTVVENSEVQINTLKNKLYESENFMRSFKDHFERGKMELHDYLKNLCHDREQIQKELTRLQNENDSLLDKHTKKAQEMQEEFINFPHNLDEMQLLLLKYREDLITCKVTLEHNTEVLRSEISFLKSRLEAEQQERNNMEEALTQELSQLQSQIDAQRQLSSELESERMKRKEEERLRSLADEQNIKNVKVVESLQFEVKQLTSVKIKSDKYIQELKGKIHSLQVDLDNSEDVQRDFVKLSQTLQIQLEKIRAAETEVRWQHEDDVTECNNCKIHFNGINKKKFHCKHCGQVFCSDCLSKTVNSGPNMRPTKVCDVCHTMLVKDATPYFSTEPPSHSIG